jgi:hypothetical protein
MFVFIMDLMMTQKIWVETRILSKKIKTNIDGLVSILLFFHKYSCVGCPHYVYHISYKRN